MHLGNFFIALLLLLTFGCSHMTKVDLTEEKGGETIEKRRTLYYFVFGAIPSNKKFNASDLCRGRHPTLRNKILLKPTRQSFIHTHYWVLYSKNSSLSVCAMKKATPNRFALLSLILMFSVGCQTVTIKNDKHDSVSPTEAHGTDQYSLLLAFVPITNVPLRPASQCQGTWSQLEVGHRAGDVLRTWGLDALFFSVTTEGLGALFLMMGEPLMQAVYGSGIVLDSQSIHLSCGKPITAAENSNLWVE